MSFARSRRGSMLLPALLLVLAAFAVLFILAARHKAPDVAHTLELQATRAAQAVDPGLWVRVDGRSVELEGRAETVADVEEAWRRLALVPGVRSVKRSDAQQLVRRSPSARPGGSDLWASTVTAPLGWMERATSVSPEQPMANAGGGSKGSGTKRRRARRRSGSTHMPLPTLAFSAGSVTLDSAARRQLDTLAPRLESRSGAVVGVTVTGGADGRDAARARAIHAALVARGVPARQVRLLSSSGPSPAPPTRPERARAHLTLLRTAS